MTRRTVPSVIIALLLPGSDLDPFLSIHMFFGANRWLTIDIGHFVLPHYGRIFPPWLVLRNDVINPCALLVDGGIKWTDNAG